jgi:hypothetical protein
MVTNNAPADRVVAIHRRLDVGHSLPLRRKGKYFFLDIPFIEPRLRLPRAADALVVPALCLESTAPNLINCGSV